MIYTDGVGTIANVREDARPGRKVNPHKPYAEAIMDACDDARLAGKGDIFRAFHPGNDD